jgi:hypothetical protein
MKNGTLFTRIIARKLQSSDRAVQFIMLAGFENKLVQATAPYFETLNPGRTLTADSIAASVAKLQTLTSSGEVCDITKSAVQKQLNKLFEQNAYNC